MKTKRKIRRPEAGEDHPSEDLPELLDIPALAERLGTTERHVRRLVDEKRIPYLKIGHFVRFDVTEIASWIDQCRVKIFNPSSVKHPRWYDGKG